MLQKKKHAVKVLFLWHTWEKIVPGLPQKNASTTVEDEENRYQLQIYTPPKVLEKTHNQNRISGCSELKM